MGQEEAWLVLDLGEALVRFGRVCKGSVIQVRVGQGMSCI